MGKRAAPAKSLAPVGHRDRRVAVEQHRCQNCGRKHSLRRCQQDRTNLPGTRRISPFGPRIALDLKIIQTSCDSSIGAVPAASR